MEGDEAGCAEGALGCLICMGIVSLDDIRDYWTEKTRQPFLVGPCHRDRFRSLRTNLRLGLEESERDNRLRKREQLIGTMENHPLQ